jgi:hypothetical protein
MDVMQAMQSIVDRVTHQRRLRVIVAAVTQEWSVFSCPRCHQESMLCGHAPDLSGLLCASCESDDFEKWVKDYIARDAMGQKRSA